MNHLKFNITLLLSGLFLFSFGQTPLSLSEAIRISLQNNYQIQIAESQIAIAQNNNNWKQAGRYPTLDLNLNSTNNFSSINNPASFLDGLDLTTLGVTPSVDLQWVLFDGYKVKITKQRLEQLEMQSLGNKEIVVESTIQAVMLAYYRASIEQEKIGVLEEVLQLSKDRYDYEVIKKDLGTGSTFNILQTRDAYLSDSINLILQQNIFRQAIRNLNLAMGESNPEKTYRLSDKLTFSKGNYTLADLEQKVFSENRNLRNQFINLQLLKTETEFQQSNRQPRVVLGLGTNYALSQNYLGDLSASGNTYQFYLNFSVNFNLYDAGRTRRAIENAITNEKIGELNIIEQKRTLKNQLAQSVAAYNDQVQLIELNEARITNAKQNLEVAETRFKSGVITSFDYRNIQIAYLRAALTRLETIFNLKTTETDLLRLSGGIISLQ